jgi:P-type Cu+ transporter
MAPASQMHEALDPVCGMTVRVAKARYIATHEGQTYYFCSAGCQKTFEAKPGSFIGAA